MKIRTTLRGMDEEGNARVEWSGITLGQRR
jgi:hypothetical protein